MAYPIHRPVPEERKTLATVAFVFAVIAFVGWVAVGGVFMAVINRNVREGDPNLEHLSDLEAFGLLGFMFAAVVWAVLELASIVMAIVVLFRGGGRGRAIAAILVSLAGPVAGFGVLLVLLETG